MIEMQHRNKNSESNESSKSSMVEETNGNFYFSLPWLYEWTNLRLTKLWVNHIILLYRPKENEKEKKEGKQSHGTRPRVAIPGQFYVTLTSHCVHVLSLNKSRATNMQIQESTSQRSAFRSYRKDIMPESRYL